MRTISAGAVLACALFAALPSCKKKSPPSDLATTTASPAAETCPPLSCLGKCTCGSRQKCVHGTCGWDPAYHVQQIALGGSTFACALYANGEVWCAGKNVVGQLGNGKPPVGPSAVDEMPAKVVEIGAASQIAIGASHACALVDGSVWCWGQSTSTPAKVIGVDDAIVIAAGPSHSCAIKNDRSVVCWASTEVAVRPIKGISNARDLALGLQTSCVLRTDGTVACWPIGGSPSPMPGVKNALELARSQYSTCAWVLGGAVCSGGRFGPRPVDVPQLKGTRHAAAGTDLICGIATDGSGELRCSDPKSDYRVTVGDSGVPVNARLVAASGEFTVNVHQSPPEEIDVVDADDDHPSKHVIDALGSGSVPPADSLLLDSEKPKPVELVPSCDYQPVSGTCVEYPNGSADGDALDRCHNESGVWSSVAPCPREKEIGACLIGSKLDHGATMIIYVSKFTHGAADARAMCESGFDGTFSAL